MAQLAETKKKRELTDTLLPVVASMFGMRQWIFVRGPAAKMKSRGETGCLPPGSPLTPVVNGIGQLIDFVDPFDVFQPSWPSWEPILDIIHLRIGGEWELRPEPGFGEEGLSIQLRLEIKR